MSARAGVQRGNEHEARVEPQARRSPTSDPASLKTSAKLGLDSMPPLNEDQACMQPSSQSDVSNQQGNLVTNSVTNLLGNQGQSRATVTNFVTKLRAIQGNEITTFGESRSMEGN
jgi:hypothetical protein